MRNGKPGVVQVLASRVYRRFGKRCFDLTLTCAGLFFVWPLLLLLAWLVRSKLGSPVLFRQQRLGKEGQEFYVTKFRTMTDERDADGNLLPDGERLTRFGRFLRSSSLDELPELLNVLKGEMSLVGPRPLVARYKDRYSPRQFRRHEVRPGITGWAQINGRNAISWEERFELDLWYVENYNLGLDLKILFRTFHKAAVREGISQKGHDTMEEFKGTCAL